jgi:hypothetical protein
MKRLTVVLLAALFCAVVSDASARTWTGRRGRLKVEAEYVETVGNSARLRKTNGQVITVPLLLLSDADREYIKKLEQEKAREQADGPREVETTTGGIVRPGDGNNYEEATAGNNYEEATIGPAILPGGKVEFARVTPTGTIRGGTIAGPRPAIKIPAPPRALTAAQKVAVLRASGVSGAREDSLRTARLTPRKIWDSENNLVVYGADVVAPGGIGTVGGETSQEGYIRYFPGPEKKCLCLSISVERGKMYLVDVLAACSHDDMSYAIDGQDFQMEIRKEAAGGHHLLFGLNPARGGRCWIEVSAAEAKAWYFFGCEVTRVD